MERENKVLAAAELLKLHCEQNSDRDICNGCPLLNGGFCIASVNCEPQYWDLPEVQDDE